MAPGHEELDEAIGKFVRDTLEREGPVTGWVLCVSHMKYTDDEPIYGWDYSCGPQTDLVRAIGLLEVVRADVDGTVRRAAEPDDEDGDD